MSRYTYGDTDLATERLALLAATFEPVSRPFVARVAPREPRLAVDLGCGPGATTTMLRDVTRAHRVVGLDASPAHVARAAAAAPSGTTFAIHDATVTPFPVRPADFVYARLLLAHLPMPVEHVTAWAGELGPDGVLALDDLESIATDEPVFRSYLDEVALRVVEREGGALFVGPALHDMLDPPGTARFHDTVVSFRPPADVTARIFSMNLAVLVDRQEVTSRPELAAELEAIALGRSDVERIEWSFRQVAFRRPRDGRRRADR